MEFKGSREERRGSGDGGAGWDEAGAGQLGAPFESFSEEDEDIFEELRDLPSDPAEAEALFLKYPELRLAWSELEQGEEAAGTEVDEAIFEEVRDLPSGPEEVEALFLEDSELRLARPDLEGVEEAAGEEEAQWLLSPEQLRAGPETATHELRESHGKKIDLSDARDVSGWFPKAAGPDEILVRRKGDGSVTAYAVYDTDGLPIKRVDVDPNSAPHGGVPPPHVRETQKHTNPETGKVYIKWNRMCRPARPDELPQ